MTKNIITLGLQIIPISNSIDSYKLIDEAKTAVRQDSKSSMGDKYETGREMMALEMRKLMEQLQVNSQLKQVLSELTTNLTSEKIAVGSMIRTSIGIFYLSVSLGKISVEGHSIFALSAVSPLGKLLMNKREGDNLIFNGKTVEITSLE